MPGFRSNRYARSQKNSPLRILIPIIVLAGAIGIVFALFQNSQSQVKNRAAQTQQVDQTGADDAVDATAEERTPVDQPDTTEPVDADQPETPADEVPESVDPDGPTTPLIGAPDEGEVQPTQPVTGDGLFDGLRARVFGPNPQDSVAATLGSPYFDSDYNLEVELTYLGAGVKRILLNKEFETASDLVAARERRQAGETDIEAEGQFVLTNFGEQPVTQADGSTVTYRLVPLAAVAMLVEDQRVDLFGGINGQLWRAGDRPGEMIAEIENASGQVVARGPFVRGQAEQLRHRRRTARREPDRPAADLRVGAGRPARSRARQDRLLTAVDAAYPLRLHADRPAGLAGSAGRGRRSPEAPDERAG
ncbi:MAG: hypothetical protein ACFHWZ_05920 [Phycisphaerales bacterium]